jgi:hypothetical protein
VGHHPPTCVGASTHREKSGSQCREKGACSTPTTGAPFHARKGAHCSMNFRGPHRGSTAPLRKFARLRPFMLRTISRQLSTTDQGLLQANQLLNRSSWEKHSIQRFHAHRGWSGLRNQLPAAERGLQRLFQQQGGPLAFSHEEGGTKVYEP